MDKIEYRIREVPRYIVTRFESSETSVGSSVCGEYDNADMAYAVGYALAQADHTRLGYALDDDRIVYPKHPSLCDCIKG